MKHEWIEMFRREIRTLKYGSPLYRMLKDELKERGNWRNRPRGKPFEGKREENRTRDQEVRQ